MRVSSIKIANVKSIDESPQIRLDDITLLVGPNNSGKSTIIASLHALQTTGNLRPSHRRFGADRLEISCTLSGTILAPWRNFSEGYPDGPRVALVTGTGGQMQFVVGGLSYAVEPIPSQEPQNFIYPFLSRRKTAHYSELINDHESRDVRTDLSNLVAKVDRLNDPRHPSHARFTELVDGIIGLPLTSIQSTNGKQIGIWFNNTEWMSLAEMGEGVSQMLGLIVNLCIASGKLFLIEELENDVHPEALKKLLDAILAATPANQFVISTHNNVVVRHLGGMRSTRIYETSRGETIEALTPTKIVEVGRGGPERIALLSRLGYEFSDMDLYDGWVLLEESSAERIVRQFLIPWFAPKLSRIRFVAAQGTGDLDRSFNALEKLVLFTHMQDRYKGKVQVWADGDPSGVDAIAKLRIKYASWGLDAFQTFTESDFERYYPSHFSEEIDAALGVTNRQKRREAKHLLLERVVAWCEQDATAAKDQFQVSGLEVIDRLRALERAL